MPPRSSNTNLTDIVNPHGYSPGETASLTEGILHEFTCTITGTRPAAQVAWIIGSEEQTSNVQNIVQENADDPLLSDTISKLTIANPTRSYHFNDLSCLSFIMARSIHSYKFPLDLEVQGKYNDPSDMTAWFETHDHHLTNRW